MRQKIILLFLLIIVFVFGIWSIKSSVTIIQNENFKIIVATSTEQTISEKTATTEPKKITETKPKPVTVQKPEISIPVAIKEQIVEPIPDFEAINTFAREATVNILCTTKSSSFSPISGTGMIISSNGLILTNAHVAQYFLLRDLYQKDFIECIIRNGSPAYPRYNAELVYISPVWVEKNKTKINKQNPQGTGENDFAFLRITKKVDGSDLSVFPYIPTNIREKIDVNEPVVLVSYPAGFLGGLSILQGLNLTSAITTIQNIFTLKENTIDVIAVGGTVVSQKGASGGAVVDKNYSLIGIISTSSEGDTTSSRDLNAITLAYINRTLKNEAGFTLPEFLQLDLSVFTKSFQENTAPDLTKLLTDEITKNQ